MPKKNKCSPFAGKKQINLEQLEYDLRGSKKKFQVLTKDGKPVTKTGPRIQKGKKSSIPLLSFLIGRGRS